MIENNHNTVNFWTQIFMSHYDREGGYRADAMIVPDKGQWRAVLYPFVGVNNTFLRVKKNPSTGVRYVDQSALLYHPDPPLQINIIDAENQPDQSDKKKGRGFSGLPSSTSAKIWVPLQSDNALYKSTVTEMKELNIRRAAQLKAICGLVLHKSVPSDKRTSAPDKQAVAHRGQTVSSF